MTSQPLLDLPVLASCSYLVTVFLLWIPSSHFFLLDSFLLNFSPLLSLVHTQGQPTLAGKNRTANILDFVARSAVCVANTLLANCSPKVATDGVWINVCDLLWPLSECPLVGKTFAESSVLTICCIFCEPGIKSNSVKCFKGGVYHLPPLLVGDWLSACSPKDHLLATLMGLNRGLWTGCGMPCAF